MMYAFDVETSYRDGVAWVWSWGLCDEDLHTTYGNGVDWLRPLLELPDGSEVWVHNLPFDGEFVFWSLVEKGWKLTYTEDRDRKHGLFTPRIDANGMISVVIHNRGNRITLRDSNRIFRIPRVVSSSRVSSATAKEYTLSRIRRINVPCAPVSLIVLW